MNLKQYTEANRIAWNEVTPMHQAANREKSFDLFKKPDYSCLDPIVSEKLKQIDIRQKTVAQLGCNVGRELLSLKNLGAGSCTGFDISDKAIDEARQLSTHAAIRCDFICTDIYEIPSEYNGKFDFIYISIGVFGWMPDLNRFFAILSRLMSDDGTVLIYEQHPFLEMFPNDPGSDPLRVTLPYFKEEPLVDEGGLDYYGNTKYKGSTHYWFSHKLSDILNGLIQNDIALVSFDEYPHDISDTYEHLEQQKIQLPMSYILVGKKNGRK